MSDQQAKKVKGGVADIIFLIDATGSMAPGIDAVKRCIGDFVTSLVNPSIPYVAPVKDWRIAIYAYRDYEYDGPDKWFVANPFSRDLGTILHQLETLHAEGGGDEPESLLDALWTIGKIREMDRCVVAVSEEDATMWRHHTHAARFVIVLSDARFHDDVPSSPNTTMEDIVKVMDSALIRLTIFAPEFLDFNGYEILSECRYAKYIPVPLYESDPVQALAAFVSNDANFGTVLRNLSASICHVCTHL